MVMFHSIQVIVGARLLLDDFRQGRYISLSYAHVHLCRNCFEAYCTHKFRMSFGKNRLVRDGEKALVAFSGGLSSTAMLHLVQEVKCFP